jgi:hypothetical protein
MLETSVFYQFVTALPGRSVHIGKQHLEPNHIRVVQGNQAGKEETK